MRRLPSLFRRLGADRKGATLVEFGLVAAPLCLILMGFGDLAYQSYLRAVTEGVLNRAGRAASVGTMTSDQIDAYITAQVQAVLPKNAETPEIVKKSYYDYTKVLQPEKITTDTAPYGVYNSTDCYEDANGNGKYDTDVGNTGLGGADDRVYYLVTVRMPRMFPMAKMLGWPEKQSFTATTIIRNQPWANQTPPATTIRCS